MTITRVLNAGLFYSLLALIALVAVPYGTVDQWWKSVFQALVFLLAAVAVFEHWLRGKANHGGSASSAGLSLLWPLLAIIIFALIQIFPWSSSSLAAVNVPRTLSADPYQTLLFTVQLGALAVAGYLLLRYTSSESRLRHLVELIIALGVVSAGFGLWRQARQSQVGFVLPYLRPGFGYGQFANSNHFAFLMELALGLALGIVVCRGGRALSKRRLIVYLLCAVPMWVALVLANSRGGILSVLCQTVFLAALLVSRGRQSGRERDRKNHFSPRRLLLVRVLLIVVLLIGAVVTVVFVGGDPLVGRIDNISVELDRQTADKFTLRQNIWRATWALIKDHPVAGVGFGGYRVAIAEYHQASGETAPQEAHNDYLELVASGGLIGLAIGVWFIVVFARTARRSLRTAGPFQRAVTMGALSGILAVAVHSLVDFGLHVTINALVFAALLAIVSLNAGSEAEAIAPGDD